MFIKIFYYSKNEVNSIINWCVYSIHYIYIHIYIFTYIYIYTELGGASLLFCGTRALLLFSGAPEAFGRSFLNQVIKS